MSDIFLEIFSRVLNEKIIIASNNCQRFAKGLTIYRDHEIECLIKGQVQADELRLLHQVKKAFDAKIMQVIK